MSRLAPVFYQLYAQLYIMKNNKHLQQELSTSLANVYHDYIATLEKFSDEQINEIPFEGSWTPGQVTDHIIKATSGIPDKYTEPVARPYNEKIGVMESIFLDFKAKYKSPDFVVPGNGPFNKETLINMLRGILDKHLRKTAESDLTALCPKFELPNVGTMTRYEWLRFIVAHMKRHHFQLTNILNAMAAAKRS
jgi:hypothetical protein